MDRQRIRTLKEKMADQNEEQLATPNNPPEAATPRRELKERNGCLVLPLKNGNFKEMTNFTPECVGYVKKSALVVKAMGFLVKVTQKEADSEEAETDQEHEGTDGDEVFFLTWKDMSSQLAIMDKINLKNLWTQPSKDQFLPAYFKKICDEYRAKPSARQCIPVLVHGLQPHSNPPTWVYMSNEGNRMKPKPVIMQLQDEQIVLLREEDAAFAILESKLPILSISDTTNGSGTAMLEVLTFAREHFKENYGGFLLAVGGLAMAFHFETLAYQAKLNIPGVLIIGSPVSCKSKVVELLMGTLGMQDASVGDPSYAGLLKCISNNPLPRHWEDVNDVDTFDRIAKNTYNNRGGSSPNSDWCSNRAKRDI